MIPTSREIEEARSPRGGWTRATLARWGVPWPPPKGWRKQLEAATQGATHPADPAIRLLELEELEMVAGILRAHAEVAFERGDGDAVVLNSLATWFAERVMDKQRESVNPHLEGEAQGPSMRWRYSGMPRC